IALTRSVADRILNLPSRDECASTAVHRFSASVADYIEPATLWRVYSSGDIANAYMTSRNRCEWTLPSHNAEDVALNAGQAAPSPEEEFARQRTELARMML